MTFDDLMRKQAAPARPAVTSHSAPTVAATNPGVAPPAAAIPPKSAPSVQPPKNQPAPNALQAVQQQQQQASPGPLQQTMQNIRGSETWQSLDPLHQAVASGASMALPGALLGAVYGGATAKDGETMSGIVGGAFKGGLMSGAAGAGAGYLSHQMSTPMPPKTGELHKTSAAIAKHDGYQFEGDEITLKTACAILGQRLLKTAENQKRIRLGILALKNVQK